MKIRRLLIFDLDGTLMDTRLDLCQGINLMRRHYGLPPLAPATIISYVGDGLRSLVARSLQGQPVDLDEAVLINSQFYHQHLYDNTTLYLGVAAGLQQLAAHGYSLALNSNKPENACHVLLRHFQLEKLFCAVLGGQSGRELKPHPESILTAMQICRADSKHTWMIGDHATDLAAAQRAGVRSVFVSYGIGRPQQQPHDKVFASFSELTGFFLDLIANQ